MLQTKTRFASAAKRMSHLNEADLAALHALIDQAKRGEGQVALLSGEAGVGKSRLVAEVKIYAANQGFLLLQGNCFQADSNLFHAGTCVPPAPGSQPGCASIRDRTATSSRHRFGLVGRQHHGISCAGLPAARSIAASGGGSQSGNASRAAARDLTRTAHELGLG